MTAAGIRGRSAVLAFALALAIVAVPRPALRLPTFHRASSYGDIPLSYEPNVGQTDGSVSYLAHGKGFSVSLSAAAMFVSSGRSSYVMRVVGADPHAKAVASDRLPGVVNYLRGNDRTKWHTKIPTYAQVRYANVLPGIDVVYRGSRSTPEYDFDIAPGADPARIAVGFDGMRPSVRNGELHAGALTERAPHAFQIVNGRRRAVRASWRVDGNRASFEVGAYDHRRPLVIDPLVRLDFATFLGGTGQDNASGIAVDGNGATYIIGSTALGSHYPTTAGAFDRSHTSKDAFVTKLNPKGTALVFSTFIGGSGNDSGSAIVIDSQLRPVITGTTSSADFPTTAGAMDTALGGTSDAFVATLAQTGASLVGSTFLGGSASDDGRSVALNSAGSIVLTGQTTSTDLPVANAFDATADGSNDAFFGKLKSDLSGPLVLSYLGGSGEDFGDGVAVDASNNIFVVGSTGSSNFPAPAGFDTTANGGSDAFVMKFTTNGALTFSTFLGGSANEDAGGVAVDGTGRPYVTGFTESTDFPTTPGAFQDGLHSDRDAYVTRLSSDGLTLGYSTYLGGNDDDSGEAIDVDANNNAYVVGDTASDDFPMGGDRFDPTFNGGLDAFAAEVDSTGALDGGTFLGGTGTDFGRGVAVGPGTVPAIYVAGTMTHSFVDFKATKNAFDTTDNDADGFVAKLSPRRMAIGDVKHLEGDSGKTLFVFPVRLNASSVETIRVNFATADASATAPSDYLPVSGTLTFNPGETQKNVTVKVIGDHHREPGETFLVQLSSLNGPALLGDAQATGTIRNDD